MTSDTAMTEENADQLRIVASLAVTSSSICATTMDLQIGFESDVRLDVFCNCFDNSLDNYTLSYMYMYYSVRCKDRYQIVELEERITE